MVEFGATRRCERRAQEASTGETAGYRWRSGVLIRRTRALTVTDPTGTTGHVQNRDQLVLAVIDDGLTEKEVTNSADDGIARLTRVEPRPHEIRVVTSDSRLTDRVREAGASTYTAHTFPNLTDPLR